MENLTFELKVEIGVRKFLNGEGKLELIRKDLRLKSTKDITNKLIELGYPMYRGANPTTVINMKKAIEEYVADPENNSIRQLSLKYNVSEVPLSKRIKSLGIEVRNKQNELKFDETIFDVIDSEEKAYWLGFIFADGYIGSDRNVFEIGLKDTDSPHLEKFNKFMKHKDPNHIKFSESKCSNGVICKKCKWTIYNTHLWNTLNDYGCVPNKSLILLFPSKNIFKDISLIKHFIRGYWDGDGCLSYRNKDHTIAAVNIIGTEDFLTELQQNLPLKYKYSMAHLKPGLETSTRRFTIEGKNAFELMYYLYENSTIYLQRKYEKYLEYCRLYKELYRELQTENGKVCDDNPVLSSEIKESEPVLSVEIEPEKSE